VEEYGIDECFGDLTGLRRMHHMGYEEIARKIKNELRRELDITFSVGLSATKVLAKVGSKYAKPDGFTPIRLIEKDRFLGNTTVDKVWGIGPQTAELLNKYGVQTALQFIKKDEAWVKRVLTKPGHELWQELQGIPVYELNTEKKESYRSMQKTRTFSPASSNATFVYSQLSKNIEGACAKARAHGLCATGFSFFLKSSEFRYRGAEVKLARPTNAPHELLIALQPSFLKVFRKGTRYRATGVTLVGLQESGEGQLDLFSEPGKQEGVTRLFERVDELTDRYGRGTIYLASSMNAVAAGKKAGAGSSIGSTSKTRAHALFDGKERKKIFPLPFLGEVG